MKNGVIFLYQSFLHTIFNSIYSYSPLSVLPITINIASKMSYSFLMMFWKRNDLVPTLVVNPQRSFSLGSCMINVTSCIREHLNFLCHCFNLLFQFFLPEPDILVPFFKTIFCVQLILLGVVFVLLNKLRCQVPQGFRFLSGSISSK